MKLIWYDFEKVRKEKREGAIKESFKEEEEEGKNSVKKSEKVLGIYRKKCSGKFSKYSFIKLSK